MPYFRITFFKDRSNPHNCWNIHEEERFSLIKTRHQVLKNRLADLPKQKTKQVLLVRLLSAAEGRGVLIGIVGRDLTIKLYYPWSYSLS